MRSLCVVFCLVLGLGGLPVHAVLQDDPVKATDLKLIGFQPEQEQTLTIYLNSLFSHESKNGFKGTPLHQKIFGGPIAGATYRNYLQKRVNRLVNIENKIPGVSTVSFKGPTPLLRATLGELDVKGALLIGTAFFNKQDIDHDLDFFKHLSRLIRGVSMAKNKFTSCYAVLRFLGLSGDCVSNVNDPSVTGLVFLYNMALSENYNWQLIHMIPEHRLESIVDGARIELADDLRTTRFASEWRP